MGATLHLVNQTDKSSQLLDLEMPLRKFELVTHKHYFKGCETLLGDLNWTFRFLIELPLPNSNEDQSVQELV